MVQNMSVFICPKCGEETHIFGHEGVLRTCAEHQVDLLGNIPLHADICNDADRGKPTVVAEPESSRANSFIELQKTIAKKLGI
jgi:ATP-binding protein involved in chromosome partitioning